MGIIGSHVDLYLLAAGTSSKTAVGSGIRLIVRAIRRLSRTGISTVAGAMGISRQEPPRKTLHSLCYPPRDAPLRRSRRCPSFSAHKVNGTKRSPPPLPPLFLAVPAVLAYAAVVPALSRPPETRYLLIPRRKSSDADKESTQTARRQLPLSSDLFLWPKNPGAPSWHGGCARKRPHRNLPTWGRESSLSPAARLVLFAEEAWVVHARAVGRRVERVLHLGWVE